MLRRFEVISAQKIDGQWMLKQMRVETLDPETKKILNRTYLEILGKARVLLIRAGGVWGAHASPRAIFRRPAGKPCSASTLRRRQAAADATRMLPKTRRSHPSENFFRRLL